jgi:hypothetical protein
MAPAYEALRQQEPLIYWQHLYGGRRDRWQLVGALERPGDLWAAAVAWWRDDGTGRVMPRAHHSLALPEASHSELVDVGLWDRRNLWRFLLR